MLRGQRSTTWLPGVVSRVTLHQGHSRAFCLKVSFNLRCHLPLRVPFFLFSLHAHPAKLGECWLDGSQSVETEAALLFAWTSKRCSLPLQAPFSSSLRGTGFEQQTSRNRISSVQSTEPEGADRARITGCEPGFQVN